MSVGAWEPANKASNDQSSREIDRALLVQIFEKMGCATSPDLDAKESPATTPDLTRADLSGLPAALKSAHWLAGLPATQWLEEAQQWQPEQVWALIRFFALAEAQLDWPGGAESPVIPLAKSLRQRKAPLSRDQLLWIREHSDNRYLPYGPL